MWRGSRGRRVMRAWGDGRLGVGVAHLPAGGDGGDGEDAFHPGEGLADALAAAAAEGEVGELVAGGLGLGGEAVGVEAEGVGEEFWGAVHDVLGEEKVGSGGDAVGAELDVLGGEAAHGPSGGVEAHGFGEDLLGVAELREVGEGGEAWTHVLGSRCGVPEFGWAQDVVEFGVEAGFGFGILAEAVPGPGQGVGNGFVAGEEDGEDFVADLLVVHAFGSADGVFVFVAGGEKHGEEVAAVAVVGGEVGGGTGVGPDTHLRGGGLAVSAGSFQFFAGGFELFVAGFHFFAALANDAVDDRVEAGAGAAEFDDAGDGEVDETLEGGEGDEEVVEIHDGVDFVVDGANLVGDFGVEEGAGGDFERKAEHGVVDVEGLTGLPTVGVGAGGVGDGAGIGGNALPVEGGRGDFALAHVDGVVGGDETFAEEDFHALEGAFLDEGGGLVDEDFTDEAGLVGEDDPGAEEGVAGGGAEDAFEVLEEADGVAELDPLLMRVERHGVAQTGREAIGGGERAGGLWEVRGGVDFGDVFEGRRHGGRGGHG